MAYVFKYYNGLVLRNNSYIATFADFMAANPGFPLVENEYREFGFKDETGVLYVENIDSEGLAYPQNIVDNLDFIGAGFSLDRKHINAVKSTVTSMQTAMDSLDTSVSNIETAIGSMETAMEDFAVIEHTHTVSEITDFESATDGRITTKIDALLNGAGSAYNTLKEFQDLIIADESTAAALAITVGNKVDKDGTKVLSANDFTTLLKNKLDAIAAGATVNTKANVLVTGTPTDRLGAFPIFRQGTVASGIVVFYLTDNNAANGNPLFPNGIIEESINLIVNDATASYQMSYTLTNSNKTLTVTANKLTTANILSGVLGQGQANSAVVKLQVWGY